MARLDTQRPTNRPQIRQMMKKFVRGFTVNPHVPWGNVKGASAVAVVTVANAGAPGTYTWSGTPGVNPTLAQLITLNPARTPASGAWLTGTSVPVTGGTTAYWNNTTYIAGVAP